MSINALSSAAPLSTPNNFKYNGKEKQTEFSLNWYDYGARMYNPALARWNGVDASSENYINQSPYHYAGNNPTLFVDYDGNDYGITVKNNENGDGGTITISAVYYVSKGDDEAIKSLSDGIDLWNNKSGTYSLTTTNDNGDEVTYDINFDLQLKEVDDPKTSLNQGMRKIARGDSETTPGNSFEIVGENDIKDPYARGITYAMNKIKVPEDDKGVKVSGHEIGHTLGIEDKSNGIMSINGTVAINQWTVNDIIKFARKTNSDDPNNIKVVVNGAIPDGEVKPKR